MIVSRIEATTANWADPLPLQVKNVKGGMNRRTVVGLGLGLAATSVLAPARGGSSDDREVISCDILLGDK